MIAWWWLLIACAVVGYVSFVFGCFQVGRTIRKELKNPESALYKQMVGFSDELDRLEVDSFSKLAEMADDMTHCPLRCGHTIAEGFRATIKKKGATV